MKKFLVMMVIGIFILAGCDINLNTGGNNSENDENSKKSNKAKATSKMKDFKIGQVVNADGVDVRVTKVEFINNYDEYSAPENGKAIRVYMKFKNNNDDQVLIDSTDFSMKVDNENYQEWFGSDDMNDGFSHQLNKGNTASGYITYDVPDSDEYALEMDASPNFESVKARWKIKKQDIKDGATGSGSQTTAPVETEKEPDESTDDSDDSEDTESEDTESEDTPYTADMYNDLVDEYNGLTDGEKMDHVDHDVLEIEYTQLEERIEALYEKQIEEEDKALEEELKEQDEAYDKEMEEIDKQYEEDMKDLEDEDDTETDDSTADDSETTEEKAE
ncbi:DUF4352 domain-containing protein [Staphylococcus sp. ACRSN]|uniref:DUF4352 domain-containing protein n=1 Tax=Staphylococcus sp. ACRSN TaxID=2918214 RepID=UPI001EF29A72|nr:DUF4352 domain-containing protein [Staphylococcus sp. ACRSN]MCG7339173.1 DUF4352 domain-containing protein [Staphylococcus sp. ACRSN]